jgi:hypothetical protein
MPLSLRSFAAGKTKLPHRLTSSMLQFNIEFLVVLSGVHGLMDFSRLIALIGRVNALLRWLYRSRSSLRPGSFAIAGHTISIQRMVDSMIEAG